MVILAAASLIWVRSLGVRVRVVAALFSSSRWSLVVPGMGTMEGAWARSQARATWAGVAEWAAGDGREEVDDGLVGGAGLRGETGEAGTEVGGVELRRYRPFCR